MSKNASRIETQIRELIRIRDPIKEPRNTHASLHLVKAWQQQRLKKSFAQLLESPRYNKAAQFFLDELYGDFDLRARDLDLARMAPTLRRFLPEHAQAALADAIELDALSHQLDLDLASQLPKNLQTLDVKTYAKAYRESKAAAQRDRQLHLIEVVGHQLDRLVRQTWLGPVIKLARVPAEMLGIASMHRFLVNGLNAFRVMRGADEFIQIIVDGETKIKNRLLSNQPDPFEFELNLKI